MEKVLHGCVQIRCEFTSLNVPTADHTPTLLASIVCEEFHGQEKEHHMETLENIIYNARGT